MGDDSIRVERLGGFTCIVSNPLSTCHGNGVMELIRWSVHGVLVLLIFFGVFFNSAVFNRCLHFALSSIPLRLHMSFILLGLVVPQPLLWPRGPTAPREVTLATGHSSPGCDARLAPKAGAPSNHPAACSNSCHDQASTFLQHRFLYKKWRSVPTSYHDFCIRSGGQCLLLITICSKIQCSRILSCT